MEPGLVLDVAHGEVRQQQWLEGEPERSFWVGLKTKGRESHPVRTFRCDRCGYLESYAIGA
jgi:hypothetical protein